MIEPYARCVPSSACGGGVGRGQLRGAFPPLQLSPASGGEGPPSPARNPRTKFPIQLSNSQRSAARLDGGGYPLPVFRSLKKMRGAERRQALVRKRRTRSPASRSGRSPRTLRDHRPMTRTGAPLGALLRRSPYGAGPRFQQRLRAAISQLLAGDRSVPGRSPDAARERGCEPRPRAPHRRRPGIAGRPPPKPRTCSPARSPIRSALKTPHECAPLAEQGARRINQDSAPGISSHADVINPTGNPAARRIVISVEPNSVMVSSSSHIA